MKRYVALRRLFSRGHEFFIVLTNKLVSTILSFLLVKLIILALNDSTVYGLYVYYYTLASWLVALTYSPANVPLAKLSSSLQDNFYGIKHITRLLSITAIPIFVIGIAITFLALRHHPSVQLDIFSQLLFLIPLTAVAIGTVGLIETYILGQRNRLISLVLTNFILLARITGIALLVLLGIQSIQLSLLSIALASLCVTALATLYFIHGFEQTSIRTKVFAYGDMSSQYKVNWLFSVLSNSMLYIDKIFISYFVPIQSIGSLALYQLIARGASNLTIGSIYQYAIPIYLAKSTSDVSNVFVKHVKTLGLCILLFMVPVVSLGQFITPIGRYLSNDIIKLDYVEFVLVCLSVCLNQSAKIIELEYFRSNAIKKLYIPLLTSITVFASLVVIITPNYGLIGAIYVLVVTAVVRLAFTLLGVRRLAEGVKYKNDPA